jgi:hypothetical protein
MMAEETKVTLAHGNKEREFTIQHAEALLTYQQSKGFTDWQLPENSAFKFENGTINPAKPGDTKKSGK